MRAAYFFEVLFLVLLAALIAAAPQPAAPAASNETLPAPERVLGLIRATFKSHRPPPPYVTYTLERKQNDIHGFPDYVGSYTYHVWCRTTDRAALERRVYRGTYRGPLEWQRIAFNEDRDPGPPTADVFEPAPAKPRPQSFVPTPEPSAGPDGLRVIASTGVIGEFDYRVRSLDVQGGDVHLVIEPTRDPDRNRLREIWADKSTYELHRLIATDKLFVGTGRDQLIYGERFDVTIEHLNGIPVVTRIHGVAGDGYDDDGKEVDFYFRDITFPTQLPAWYFDSKAYAMHTGDAPL